MFRRKLTKEQLKVKWYVEHTIPLPFMHRYRVYDENHKWLATFKYKNDAIRFVS